MKDRTKLMYAKCLIEMLEEITLDKVRVIELVRRCGTTAPTFYYHFKDKYELVAWIYLRDYSNAVGRQEDGYSPETLAATLRAVDKRRIFYQKVFSEDSQNSISSYCMGLSFSLAMEALKLKGGGAPTEEQELAVRYHCYGLLGMLKEWLVTNDPVPAEVLARLFYDRTPDFLKECFDRMEYEPESTMSSKL